MFDKNIRLFHPENRDFIERRITEPVNTEQMRDAILSRMWVIHPALLRNRFLWYLFFALLFLLAVGIGWIGLNALLSPYYSDVAGIAGLSASALLLVLSGQVMRALLMYRTGTIKDMMSRLLTEGKIIEGTLVDLSVKHHTYDYRISIDGEETKTLSYYVRDNPLNRDNIGCKLKILYVDEKINAPL
jgi:hypothetical protein